MANTNAVAMKRINREIAEVAKEPRATEGAISLAPSEVNVFEWKGTIPGPEGSVYAGGIFDVSINLPKDYPFSAPKVKFLTRIYHPNISDRGDICIDILKSQWSPALSLYKVMLSISSLLTDPNPKDPLVAAIAKEYLMARPQFEATARFWTRQYALPATAAAVAPPAPKPAPKPAASSRRSTRTANSVYPAASSSRPSTLSFPSATSVVALPGAADSSAAAATTTTVTGKRKAANVSQQQRQRQTRSTGPADTIVVVDDSDDESSSVPERRPKRRRGVQPGPTDDVIVIDD